MSEVTTVVIIPAKSSLRVAIEKTCIAWMDANGVGPEYAVDLSNRIEDLFIQVGKGPWPEGARQWSPVKYALKADISK